ncbi:glutamate--tRNA ligase [bacterium]|nr:glutamate--tRNA ligase [bacterium]
MVRVRFAPSPTGLPHIGNIRTALFNYLFAKHNNGKFILRIEDTDRERYREDALDAIIKGLKWLGINWDEGPDIGGEYGPYFQSRRIEIYHKYAKKLVDEGKAYYCDCSPERLKRVREEMRAKKLNFMYDRHCRKRNIKSDPTDPSTVIRFKMPLSGETCFDDVLRGKICFDNSTQDDIILIKSDGFPTYNFAVVIDDHLMGITHIFRGEEFISSAGKHKHIYDALGWEPPKMVHLAMILGKDRSKLSKRHGATSIMEFAEQGFLPEAMMNFLALLGWSPKDDREILSKDELVERFSLDGLSTKPAVFDIEKLEWMNGEYIRMMEVEKLTENLIPYYRKWGWINGEKYDVEYLNRVSAAMQERLKKLTDIKELGFYFFQEPSGYDEKGVRKQFKRDRIPWMKFVLEKFENLDNWREEKLEKVIAEGMEKFGVGAGKLIHPIRLAVSGLTRGPGLFELLEILGREKTIARIKRAINWIENNVEE